MKKTTKMEIEKACDDLKIALIEDMMAAELFERTSLECTKKRKALLIAQDAVRGLKGY